MSKPSAKPSKIKVQEEPFNLDAIEKEGHKHDYQVILGGRTWTMTPMGRLDKKAMKRMAKVAESGELDNTEYMDLIFQEAMGEEQFAEFDELPLSMDGLQRLFEDYQDHSGIEVPESSASTDSSHSTERPSNSTSPATGQDDA